MKLLALLPVAMLALTIAGPTDAFFHWAPWSAQGVASGTSGAYTVAMHYQGLIFYPYPFPMTITLTGPLGTTTKTFNVQEQFSCSYTYGQNEYLCLSIASTDPSVQFTASGFQYATEYNRQFTVAAYGSYNGLSFETAGIQQPF